METPLHFEENKLICEFMGCEVYESFRTPHAVNYTVRGQMVIDFRKRGFMTGGFDDKMMMENLKFDKSWDWLMIVWKEFRCDMNMAAIKISEEEVSIVNDWAKVTSDPEILNGFFVVVKAITIFNKKIMEV